jgi:6-phosphofructo-2-kinase/fructose-2,6-biphosphatase
MEKKVNFDEYELFSSPMVRTIHTLQIMCEINKINNFYKKIQIDTLLSEIDIGDFKNMYWDDVKNKYSKESWEIRDIWKYRFPNGESYIDCFNRIEKFVKKNECKKNLIVVSHGVCVYFLLNILQNRKKNFYPLRNREQTKIISLNSIVTQKT